MKFLFVNHEYPPIGGGAATASRAIAQHLYKLGHEVAVVTSRYTDVPSFEMESGVAIHRIRCMRKRADRSNLCEMLTFMMGALLSLPFIVTKYRPDALIIFFSLPSGPFGLVTKLFFGIPYAVSLRGGDVPALVPELNLLHKIVGPIRRCILKHAHVIVANSVALQKLSETADRYPVRVIPNGVDTELFRADLARSTSSLSEGPLRILFVGRFQEQKNLAFLFRQLARLSSSTFELHLAGDGPQRESLRELADHLGIAKSIRWQGWLPRAELPRIYQSSDCLVNPSLYEGMPNVVLEAMACGLPVIASRIAGHDALILHGETGLLFDLEKGEELAAAVKQLQDVDFRRHMGKRARARAVAEFSWQRVAQDYVMDIR